MNGKFAVVSGIVMLAFAFAALSQPVPLPRVPQPVEAPEAQAPPTAGRPAGSEELFADEWERWLAEYFRVIKVPRGTELRIDERHAYPHERMRTGWMEIVNEDDEFVYLRNLPLEDPKSAGHRTWLTRQLSEVQALHREQAMEGKFILPMDEIEIPHPFTDRLEFRDFSRGLPSSGHWQIGFDFGDFNGDGRLDLVLPPARRGAARPWVLLNSPEGWTIWEDAVWPEDLPFDYGDVAVADFDGDGHLDIAISIHFKDCFVMYGNGKGDFTRFERLPKRSAMKSSRALAVADFNGDGRPDIVRLAELDLDMGTGELIHDGLISVTLNTPDGWKLAPASFPAGIYGDQIAVGDLNGNGRPDILISSHKATNDIFFFLNDGTGENFLPVGGEGFPFQPYVFGVAAASLDGRMPQQAIMAMGQVVRNPPDYYVVNPIMAFRIAGEGGGLLEEPAWRVLYRDQREQDEMFRDLAVGDLDGDGRPDVVAVRGAGEVVVLLQQEDGQFLHELSPELAGMGTPSSVAIRDLDGDGRNELIINFSDRGEEPGGIKVWKTGSKKHLPAS